MMLGFGVRPGILLRDDVTIIAFAEKHLGKEFPELISMFDRMRQKRYQTMYEGSVVISKQEAEQALEIAGKYLAAIQALPYLPHLLKGIGW
jgi:hypothetical protein